MRLLILILLIMQLTCVWESHANVNGPGTYKIVIDITDGEFQQLKRPVKTHLENAEIKIFKDGELVQTENVSLSTRGQTSLKKFSRKNMAIHLNKSDDVNELDSKHKFHIGKLKAKELVLTAGPEDALLIKNLIGYKILKSIDVKSLDTELAEVVINGLSQGLYMVTESQATHLVKKDEAEVVIRRRYADAPEIKKTKNELSLKDVNQYLQVFKKIHIAAEKLKGEQLLSDLSKHLNLQSYMRWHAVNYILLNGDFSDEVVFYGKKNSQGDIYFDIARGIWMIRFRKKCIYNHCTLFLIMFCVKNRISN